MTASWHETQKARVTSYKPQKPEIPGTYGCAGDCSNPAPAPPGQELFRDINTPLGNTYVLVLGVAAALYAVIALGSKYRK